MGNWHDGLQHAALTDVGMRRRNNQDSHLVVLAPDDATWHERGHVFIVADGMGAHAAGELASKLAVDHIPHLYLKHRDLPPDEALRQAIREANSEIHRRGRAHAEFHNMGTTTSVLVLLPQGAMVAHVGDSRVYRLRGNQLEQLTFDHSLVWELRRGNNPATHNTPDYAIPKNVITRSLGPNAQVEVDLEGPFPTQPGDTYLLCSDGLTGQVTDEELQPILASLSPEEAARVLIDLANLRGGPDNITVLIARTGEIGADGSVAGATGEVRRPRPKVEMHPAIWVAAGVCFLAGIGLLLAGNLILSIALGLVGSAVLGGSWLWFASRAATASEFATSGALGKGPYTRTIGTSPTQFVENLATTATGLRQAASEASLDVRAFDDLARKAQAAVAAGDSIEALRHYSRAISALMQSFRSINRRRPSDSAIDL